MGQTRLSLIESTGDVRTQGDFQVVGVTAGTDDRVVVASPWLVAVVTGVTCNTSAGDSPTIQTWVQPANTLITQIDVWCAAAPTVATGNIGAEVGTVSGQGEIVALITDEILDGGTTVVINSVMQAILVQVTQNAATFVVSAQYTATARNIFCNIVDSTNASAAGSFTFLISYINLDTTAV